MADWSTGSAELDEVAHACADQDWPRAQALLGAYCARAQDLAARGAVDDDTLRAMLEAQQRLAACLYAVRDEAARALARLHRNDRAIGAYRQDTE